MSVLPFLNWRLIPPIRPATPTGSDVIAAYKSLIQNSCSYWQIIESPNTGSQSLIIRPVATSSNVNVVIAAGVSGSSAYRSAHDNTSFATRLQCGIVPDITENGSGSFTTFQADFPFGTNPRWSRYIHVMNTSVCSATYIAESEDSIWLGAKDSSASSGTMGVLAGAILESPESGSGENTFRLYGMMTGGPAIIGSTFWAAAAAFTSNSTSANSVHAGVFIVSGGIASQNVNNNWQTIERQGNASTNYDEFVTISGSNRASGAFHVAWPIVYHTSQTPDRHVGMSRGYYHSSDEFGLVRFQSGGVDQAYFVGTSYVVRADGFVLAPASGAVAITAAP